MIIFCARSRVHDLCFIYLIIWSLENQVQFQGRWHLLALAYSKHTISTSKQEIVSFIYIVKK